MSKGLPRSMSRGSAARQEIIKKTIPIDASVSVDGLTGVGFGSVVVGDLPEGNILLLGAVSYIRLTGPTSANLVDTFEGDYSIGTTATADATVAGTDADIIPLTAIGPATAEVTALTRAVNATAAVLDNTDGSLELNLNVLIDDLSIDANDIPIAATGNITLLYAVMSDD